MSDDSPSLADILRAAETVAPEPTPQTAAQDAVEALLDGMSTPGAPGIATVITSDPLDVVRQCMREEAGREIGHYPTWVRFHRPDRPSNLMVVLHSPSPLGEVDLLVCAHRGTLNRTILRAALRWAFYACGWPRIVARIPTDRADLGHLLRRCGFQHEGVARRAFYGIADAQVWALTLDDAARFLPRSQRPVSPIPTRDTSPPPSLKVH